MKNKWIQFAGLCLLLLSMSCHQEEDCVHPAGITGEWIWVKSIGGFGGWTLTPETENIIRKLKIDDFTFEAYVNDSLVFQSAYDLEMRPDTFWGTNRYIQFETGGEQAFLIDGNKLELFDLCFDCFNHEYKRK